MKQIHYSRKKNQIRGMVKRMEILMANPNDDNLKLIDKLILKIKRLVREIIHVLSRMELKKILGAAAVLIGFSFNNLSSAQSFAPYLQNPYGLTPVTYIAFPSFADLDGDGDKDLLVSEYLGVMQYFENIGTNTNPQFTTPVANPFGLVSIIDGSPSFADLDNDGDMDLLVGDYPGNMHYFENTGTSTNPQFAAPQENPFGLIELYYAFPAFADIDNDGDLDLLVGQMDNMQYFENTGTASNPQFTVSAENPWGLVPVNELAYPAFADLDNDGDMDLLVGEYSGSMQYFENTRSSYAAQFAAPVENPFGLTSVYENAFPAFTDLDSDGDMDLLVGDYTGSMFYFRNTSDIGIGQLSQDIELKLFPNPTSDFLILESEENIVNIEIYDLSGKLLSVTENRNGIISLDNLKPGVYSVKLHDINKNFTIRKIIKK